MDEQQRKAFEQAVERKKQEALEASRQGGKPSKPPEVLGSGSQPNLDDPSTSQDQPTPHHKGTRHGQVTAENWNQ
jgi:general stress protein YciG